MKYLIIVLLFISCTRKPDGIDDGRVYDLEKKCVKSHIERRTYNVYYGKNVWKERTDDIEICDEWAMVKIYR